MTTKLPPLESLSTLLSGVVGSAAYGMAIPGASDVDRLGVYALPTELFLGLNPPLDKDVSVVQNDPDIAFHEAGKFARLALNGNPSVNELLWLEDYETTTPLGLSLVQIRKSFLAAYRIRQAYIGYAMSQFQRLSSTGRFASKQRSRAPKHARHMLRLLDQGFELWRTGHLTVRVADPQYYIDEGAKLAADPELARDILLRAQERFVGVTSALPEHPNEAVVEDWLQQVRRQHLS